MDGRRRSRASWISAGFEVLGLVGVDKVRVDHIAERLGVTKGSFYWHFTDRAELLGAIVDRWEAQGTSEIISEVDASPRPPKDRAHHLWRLAAAGGMSGELAIRDWARRDPTIAARVKAVDQRRMQYLATLFADLGAPDDEIEPRALLAYSLLIGNHLIDTGQPLRTRGQMVTQAIALLIDTDGQALRTPERPVPEPDSV